MFFNKIIFFLFALFFIFCTKKSTIIDTNNIEPDTEHFSFVLYGSISQDILLQIKNKLESNYSRVLSDLSVDSMNTVSIKIWNNESQFLDDMYQSIGVRYRGSSGWIFSSRDIRILYSGENTPQIVLHEFCHAVTLAINIDFGNNPRWLWESVAIYEANEFVEPKTISYLENRNFPSIIELNTDFNSGNYKIYQVGYLLSEYIIHDFGKNNYVNLIKSNGDIESILKTTKKQFEENWKNFVYSKYFSKK